MVLSLVLNNIPWRCMRFHGAFVGSHSAFMDFPNGPFMAPSWCFRVVLRWDFHGVSTGHSWRAVKGNLWRLSRSVHGL